MLAMYRSLKSLLRPYVEDNESNKKKVSSDDWITVLEQMHQCVEQFDMDGVDIMPWKPWRRFRHQISSKT